MEADMNENIDGEQGGEPVTGFPVLEILCTECNGKGGSREVDRWFDCLECEGAGYVPTEAGEAIIALVRHNMKTLRKG
jgi:hypothetical protein